MKFTKVYANDFKIEVIMDDNNLDFWTYNIYQNGIENAHPMYEYKFGKILPLILIEILDRIDYHFFISIKEKIKFLEDILNEINVYAGRNSCIEWIKSCKEHVPFKKEDFIYSYCAENRNLVFHQMCIINSMYDKVGEGWYEINEQIRTKLESVEKNSFK